MNSFPSKFTISSGILHTSIKILKYFHQDISYKDISKFRNVFITDIKYPLYFLEKCGYIKSIKGDDYVLIKNIIIGSHIEQFKELLRSYIIEFKPIWTDRIKWGLSTFIKDLNSNEIHCFNEVNLLDFKNFDNVMWWNELPFYENMNLNLRTIGSLGEFLSITYERDRIKIEPTHISLLGGYHGYDILSKVTESDIRNKLIECKTTINIAKCLLHLTINEWETALNNKEDYFFHVWILNIKENIATLYEFPVSEMIMHIPSPSISQLGKFTNAELDLTTLLKDTIPTSRYDNLSLFGYHLQEL